MEQSEIKEAAPSEDVVSQDPDNLQAEETSISATICIIVSLAALAFSLAWGTGLARWAIGAAPLSTVIVVLFAGSIILGALEPKVPSWMSRAFSTAATVIAAYGVAGIWWEVALTGKYGSVPVFFDVLPGIAIQASIFAVFFCLLYHDKEMAVLSDHLRTSVMIPFWISTVAFLVFLGISFVVEDVRQTAKRAEAEQVNISLEDRSAISADEWSCHYTKRKTEVSCSAPR